MAQYKVPQDVEADDKLLGPFSFRQFIYLMIAAGLIALSVGLFQIVPFLAIIPLPPVLLLIALALPLKKDQPMETYLVALVDFYLKPRVRLWNAGQRETTIEIIAPKHDAGEARIRTISGEEATHRLSFLADIVDTEGYSIKGLESNPMRQDFAAEATTAVDMFEGSRFDSLATTIRRDEDDRHAAVVRNMQQTINAADDFMNAPLREEGLSSLNPPSVTKTIATPTSTSDLSALSSVSTRPSDLETSVTVSASPAPSASTETASSAPIEDFSEDRPAPSHEESKAEFADSAEDPEAKVASESNSDISEEDKLSAVVVTPDMEAIEAEAKAEAMGNKNSKDDQEEVREENLEVNIDLKAVTAENAKNSSDEDTSDEPVEKPVENSEDDNDKDSPNSADASIIDLANNDVFSVATIAKQAKRVNNRKEKDEVFISLH